MILSDSVTEATRIANLDIRQSEQQKGKQVGADDDADDDAENNKDMALFNKKRKGSSMRGFGGSFAKKR